MTQAIAVALVHGIGDPPREFADGMMERLRAVAAAEAKARGLPEPALVHEPVFWSPVVQERQRELLRRVNEGVSLNGMFGLRDFIVSYAADVVAYQPMPSSTYVYDRIHEKFADALKTLASKAGPAAPLVVVGHSLGSIIASNYIYDLQAEFGPYQKAGSPGPMSASLRARLKDATPLERGHTLAQLYTMGSPLALWGVRAYNPDPRFDYGAPVFVPAPELGAHQPRVAASRDAVGWVNFYDRDDVIAFPLRNLNDAHRENVKEDRPVNVGGLVRSLTPLAHTEYWTDKDVITPIGRGLAAAWAALRLNP